MSEGRGGETHHQTSWPSQIVDFLSDCWRKTDGLRAISPRNLKSNMVELSHECWWEEGVREERVQERERGSVQGYPAHNGGGDS